MPKGHRKEDTTKSSTGSRKANIELELKQWSTKLSLRRLVIYEQTIYYKALLVVNKNEFE